MPVAKSYQALPMLGEPYTRNGRKYVKVKTVRGLEKEVRWYSEAEYMRMYGEPSNDENKQTKTQKQVLGFENGFITIFKGDTYGALDWFHQSIARYTRVWGWYIVSTEQVPEDLPEGLTPIKLSWETVGNDDGSLKSETVIKNAVDELIYEPSSSQFVGEIGDRLDLELVVEKRIPLENNYGVSNLHSMVDANGNVFVWITSAKTLNEGETYSIRGTVKDHSKYKGTCQTILTRCTVR